MRLPIFTLLVTGLVHADINVGEKMSSASQCKTSCVDSGGVFCKPFGEDLSGYCCYQANQMPCDQRMMACSNSANEISKYYTCPFDSNYCGTQTLDVTEEIQEFEIYSNDFRNYTFCSYQFRKVNVNSKKINVKVIFAGERLQFQAVQGDVVNKGYNLQKLQSNKAFIGKANERIYLIAKSVSPLPDSFKIQYYLTTPQDDEIDQTDSSSKSSSQNQNTTNGSVLNSTTQESQTLAAKDTDNDSNVYINETPKTGGGTAIVVIIAVLIVLIPVGFAISCIIKRIRERNNKNNEDSMPLPDHSQSNHTQQSPEQYNQFVSNHQYNNPQPNSNLYPFGHHNNGIDDSENMQSVMNAIKQMEMGHHLQDGHVHEPIQFIEIISRQGEPMTIPVDQLPQFLQDMALNDPEIFNQLMTDMDEERLEEFIKEQDNQQFMNSQQFNIMDPSSNGVMNSDMGLNQMNFVDPQYINEQQQAFNKINFEKKPKRAQNNFMNEDQQQNEDDINMDMLVGGGRALNIGEDNGMQYGEQQPKKKKTKKKKKARRNNPIEIIDDLNTPNLPVVLDPQE